MKNSVWTRFWATSLGENTQNQDMFFHRSLFLRFLSRANFPYLHFEHNSWKILSNLSLWADFQNGPFKGALRTLKQTFQRLSELSKGPFKGGAKFRQRLWKVRSESRPCRRSRLNLDWTFEVMVVLVTSGALMIKSKIRPLNKLRSWYPAEC